MLFVFECTILALSWKRERVKKFERLIDDIPTRDVNWKLPGRMRFFTHTPSVRSSCTYIVLVIKQEIRPVTLSHLSPSGVPKIDGTKCPRRRRIVFFFLLFAHTRNTNSNVAALGAPANSTAIKTKKLNTLRHKERSTRLLYKILL